MDKKRSEVIHAMSFREGAAVNMASFRSRNELSEWAAEEILRGRIVAVDERIGIAVAARMAAAARRAFKKGDVSFGKGCLYAALALADSWRIHGEAGDVLWEYAYSKTPAPHDIARIKRVVEDML
jgi:hypothetical protein